MTTTARVNPFHVAISQLIRGLARLPAPIIDAVPEAEQIEAVGEFIAAIAKLNDEFLQIVGAELRSNTPMPIDLRNFQSAFFDAVDGFALYDIASIAMEIREQTEEV